MADTKKEVKRDMPIFKGETTLTDLAKNNPQTLGDDQVAVSKKEFSALLKRMSDFEKGVVNESVLDEPEVRELKVKLLDGAPVLDVSNVITKRDEFGEDILYIALITEKGETEVLYSDYIHEKVPGMVKVVAKILSKKVKEIKDKQGLVEVSQVDGYRTVATGVKVPVRVVSQVKTYEVELPTGDVVQLKEEAVN